MADKPVTPLVGTVLSRLTRKSNKTGNAFGIIRLLVDPSPLSAGNALVVESLVSDANAYTVGQKCHLTLQEAQYGRLAVKIDG